MNPEDLLSEINRIREKLDSLENSYLKHRHTNYDGTPVIDGDLLLRPISRIYIGTVFISSSSGTPEGVVTAPVGSIYLRDNGGASTTLYVKESGTGNTGWIAK